MGNLALLCLIAGFVDGFGYFALGHVFAANMTGNTVLLAVALAAGDWPAVGRFGATLAAFAVGVAGAALLRRRDASPLPPLLLEAAILGLSYVPGPFATLLLLAFAMGLQGATPVGSGTTRSQTIVLTATIVRLTESAIDWLAPRPGANQPTSREIAAASGAAWVAYGAGAALGVAALEASANPLAIRRASGSSSHCGSSAAASLCDFRPL